MTHANVTADIVNSYFDKLAQSLLGIPPENPWNYDKTGLADDLGKRSCIVKRRVKYPERVINANKNSVMLGGNATGKHMQGLM